MSRLSAFGNALRTTRGSHLVRVVAIGALALLLRIPIAMIDELIGERAQRRNAAVAEVTAKWGQTQALVGPALIVPYTRTWESSQQTLSETLHAVVLPTRLETHGTLASEELARGIFAIPVYTGDLRLTGAFARTDLTALGIDPASVAWERAQIALGVSNTRAIQNAAAVEWRGGRVPFLPGVSDFSIAESGIHAPVDASGDGALEFSIGLELRGSSGFYVAPLGEATRVALAGNSPNPSFQGAWLPKARQVTPAGFDARWEIPYLGRNFPQAWRVGSAPKSAIDATHFGVDIVAPVDHYRMAERSVKYAGLFILLTFATVWLVEVLARLPVHPIQYLLLGCALCLFYLLELSLAEHIGFPAAYALASAAVVGLVGAYSRAVLRRRALALAVGAGAAGLYGYLYVLLMNEDSALLIGSLGLFAILAAVMFATRNVDWFALGGARSEAPAELR